MSWRLASLCVLAFLLSLPLLLLLLLSDALIPVPPTPVLAQRWWGQGERGGLEDTSIAPYTVSVSEEQLEDLETRIRSDLPRLSAPLLGATFEYGFNTDHLKEVATYWLDGFDWAAQESQLNSLPHFTTSIDGLAVHFIRVSPQPRPGQVVLPLLLVHGWPGSVVEFLDIIPLLAKGNDKVALEVVVPSLPGYGFSSAPAREGFNCKEAAGVLHSLMARLGHSQFLAQGGDWGSLVTTSLATLFPHSVLGLHINMAGVLSVGDRVRLLASSLPGLDRLLLDQEDWDMGNDLSLLLRESGYFHLQATKPDTVGVALSSSPLGLAAYIMEKFSTWTSPSLTGLPDGGLPALNITTDKMLTNVMVYWVTNTITSSMRFYKENFPEDKAISSIPLSMPVGFAAFPHELLRVPRACLLGKFPNLLHYTRMPRGGHFGAMEEPVLLAEDVLSFAKKVVNRGLARTEL